MSGFIDDNMVLTSRGFMDEEAAYRADLDSDGAIAGHYTSQMYDEQYGAMLVGYGDRWADFYERRVTPQMRDMEQRVDNTLRDLDEQIANADTPAEKRELQAIKREVQSEWDNLQENPPPVITQRGVADGASLAKFQGEWDNRLDQMRDKLDQADSALGTPARAASSGARLASFEPLPSSVFDAVSDVADHIKDMGFLGKISDIVDRLTTPSSGSNATSNTTGTSSTEQSSNTEGSSSTEGSSETSKTERSGSTNRSSGSFIGNQEFGGKTVDEMMQMASDNPEALAEHMDGLGTEEKQKAMQAMMKRMQEINQMFTMLSNIMKSMHDTAKAAINNMRV